MTSDRLSESAWVAIIDRAGVACGEAMLPAGASPREMVVTIVIANVGTLLVAGAFA